MSNKYGGLNSNTIKNWYPPPSPFFCFWTAPGIHHFQEIWPKQHLQSCLNWTVFTHRTLWVPHHNAPSVFQALINGILWDMINRIVFVYLGDIQIFKDMGGEHPSHSGWTPAPTGDICQSWKVGVLYFHSFLPGIHCGWREPWDGSSEGFRHLHLDYAWELEAGAAFSQLFYRCFIQNYSTMAAPLTALTSAKVSFWWISLSREGFLTLKAHSCPLPSSRCLTLP